MTVIQVIVSKRLAFWNWWLLLFVMDRPDDDGQYPSAAGYNKPSSAANFCMTDLW